MQSFDQNLDAQKCTLKPISCILGNILLFEKKYFDAGDLLPGCKLYNIDEVIHDWYSINFIYLCERIPVTGNALDNLSMGLELTDENVVEIVVDEILRNDPIVASHLLINFPRNEAQSIIFEQKLSG